MTKVIKYALFAGIATLSNLGIQYVSLKIYSGEYSLWIAMFFGTGIGLAVKYLLDKAFIFYYKVKSQKENLVKFMLYSLMGVVTTAIFWGVELLFDHFIDYEWSKFAGGAIGLVIGYTIKYFLDKKFVFIKNVR